MPDHYFSVPTLGLKRKFFRPAQPAKKREFREPLKCSVRGRSQAADLDSGLCKWG